MHLCVKVAESRWSVFGHVLRMPTETPPQKALEFALFWVFQLPSRKWMTLHKPTQYILGKPQRQRTWGFENCKETSRAKDTHWEQDIMEQNEERLIAAVRMFFTTAATEHGG